MTITMRLFWDEPVVPNVAVKLVKEDLTQLKNMLKDIIVANSSLFLIDDSYDLHFAFKIVTGAWYWPFATKCFADICYPVEKAFSEEYLVSFREGYGCFCYFEDHIKCRTKQQVVEVVKTKLIQKGLIR